MRFPGKSTALTALILGSSRLAIAQEQVKVAESKSSDGTTTVWYTDPFWLGLGAVAVLIIIVLAVMASRGNPPKTTTTVIR